MKMITALLLTLFVSAPSYAYTLSNYICMESGQMQGITLANYFQASTQDEQDYVTLTTYFPDNTVQSETLRGVAPDLDFSYLVSEDEGERVLVITSIVPNDLGVAVRLLLCTPQ